MLFDVTDVIPLPDYFILITFETGETKIFDVKVLFDRPRWKALQAVELFNEISVFEGTVIWPNGLDISPEWLYEDGTPVDL